MLSSLSTKNRENLFFSGITSEVSLGNYGKPEHDNQTCVNHFIVIQFLDNLY